MTVVRESGLERNIEPNDGGVRSMNTSPPWKTAVAPGSLAKVPALSGTGSLLLISEFAVDCIVSGKAALTGIGVASAVAPWIAKLPSDTECPGVTGAPAT